MVVPTTDSPWLSLTLLRERTGPKTVNTAPVGSPQLVVGGRTLSNGCTLSIGRTLSNGDSVSNIDLQSSHVESATLSIEQLLVSSPGFGVLDSG